MRHQYYPENVNPAYDPSFDLPDDFYADYEETPQSKEADRHRIEVRRAIEERLERIRLQEEVDYFFNDHFPDIDEEKK